MARIKGVDIPNNKRVEIALTYIYGIGRVTSNKVLEATGINPDTRVKDLSEEQIGKIRNVPSFIHFQSFTNQALNYFLTPSHLSSDSRAETYVLSSDKNASSGVVAPVSCHPVTTSLQH